MPEDPEIQASPQLQFWPLPEGISVHQSENACNERSTVLLNSFHKPCQLQYIVPNLNEPAD